MDRHVQTSDRRFGPFRSSIGQPNFSAFGFGPEPTIRLWVQTPVPPVNIPIPTKIGSKMGGEFTYRPTWDPIGVDPRPKEGGAQPAALLFG